MLGNYQAAIQTDNELLSYAAGVIDGEGWIGIAVMNFKGRTDKQYQIGIKVNMTATPAVELLHRLFGGKLYFMDFSSKGYKNQTTWRLSKYEQLLSCLIKLNGRVLIKAAHVTLALRYLDIVGTGMRGINPIRERFYNDFKELNK